MRTIQRSSSVLRFWQDLVFLHAGLAADDGTTHLAALVKPVLDEFPAILQRDLDTRRAVIEASAHAYVADAGIDDAIRGLFSSVLALVQQNRKRQEFTTLFSTHIGEYVRHALRKQLDVAKDLTGKLALKLYPDDLRTTQTKRLNATVKRGAAALEDTRKAELQRVEGRLDIATWKDEANAVRLSVYGQLLALAAKNGRGKTWAEGFFPRLTATAGDEEDEDVAPPDAPEEAEPAGEGKPE